jgi:hypothetical protein
MSGTFTLGHEHLAAVWGAIRALQPREHRELVERAFELVLFNIRDDTGTVSVASDRLGPLLGASEVDALRAMRVLERIGAVLRQQARGGELWAINPHLAWRGSLDARARSAALVPPPNVKPGEAPKRGA